MISRCKFCGDIAPDDSVMCDSCCRLENEDVLFHFHGESYGYYREGEVEENYYMVINPSHSDLKDDSEYDSENWQKRSLSLWK